MRVAVLAHHRRKLLLGGEAAPVPDAAFTTFTSADYTPDADGTTATTLTFTVKDANDDPIEGYGVTYA